MCFHSTNKIYNPLTLLRPHFHTSALTCGWRWWWWESNWKSMHQFYSNKRGKTRGQKSTNLPKLAKCLEWKQRRGEMTDCAQRWAGLDGQCCIPARNRDKGTRTEKKRETDQETVCVVGVSLNWDKKKKKFMQKHCNRHTRLKFKPNWIKFEGSVSHFERYVFKSCLIQTRRQFNFYFMSFLNGHIWVSGFSKSRACFFFLNE